jgi:aromatic ring hydroxylase
MLNSAGYRNSLNDGRNVYFRGEKVTDVSQYPPVAATQMRS